MDASAWVPALSVLIGGVVTGGATMLGQHLTSNQRRQERRDEVAIAQGTARDTAVAEFFDALAKYQIGLVEHSARAAAWRDIHGDNFTDFVSIDSALPATFLSSANGLRTHGIKADLKRVERSVLDHMATAQFGWTHVDADMDKLTALADQVAAAADAARAP